ncbi:hypothetical protein KIN20_001843 [Parelaphostrongylus tenuis]|uniref:Mos1 transposase HTH domain-containing protein n=1 Tax=Parelaphostrongylus tenuis TaxID=148309 RepID=A0AAD5QD22_PARTN|nr:hypothetical protein KIN20_001843 [Parelaphostrongylus tenuis]
MLDFLTERLDTIHLYFYVVGKPPPYPMIQWNFVSYCVVIGEKVFKQRAAVDEINEVEGEGITNNPGQWFQRFNVGDLDLEKPCSERPAKFVK